MAENEAVTIDLRVTGNAGPAINRIGRDAAALRGSLAGLNSLNFAGLATRIAALVGVIGGVRKALSEARIATETDRSLQAALGNRVDAFDRLVKQAEQLQKVTKFADDTTKQVQATLLNRGVPLQQLERTTKAALDLASALNIEPEQAASAIARTFGGIVPREIGRAITALQNLTEEELRAGKAVDIITQKFGGRAEALAQTDFGKIDQQLNRIGDSFERIGNLLASIGAVALPKVADGVELVVDAATNNNRTGDAFKSSVAGSSASRLAEVIAATNPGIGVLYRQFVGRSPSLIPGTAPNSAAQNAIVNDENAVRNNAAAREANERRERINRFLSEASGQQANVQAGTDFGRITDRTGFAFTNADEGNATDDRLKQLEALRGAGLITFDQYVAAVSKIRFNRAGREFSQAKRLVGSDIPEAQYTPRFEEAIRSRLETGRKLPSLAVAAQIEEADRVAFVLTEGVKNEKEARAALNDEVQRTTNLVQSGSINIFQANQRQREAQKRYNAELEKTVAILREQQALVTDPTQIAAYEDLIRRLQEGAAILQSTFRQLSGEIKEGLRAPMEGFFTSIIKGAGSAREAFANMIQGWADNLAALAAQRATSAVLDGILAFATGAIGGAVGGLFTSGPALVGAGNPGAGLPVGVGALGPAPTTITAGRGAGLPIGVGAFNRGGMVPGSGPNVDSVPAMLTPGEFVLNRGTVQRVGASVLHRLNGAGSSYSSPRGLSLGGMVEPSSAGGSMNASVLTVDRTTGERIVRGSKTTLLDVMAENRTAFKSALGL